MGRFVLASIVLMLAVVACTPTPEPTPTRTPTVTPTATTTKVGKVPYRQSATPTPVVTPTRGATVVATAVPKPTSIIATPEPGSLPGRIAFTSDRDGKTEIYVMNADGSDQRRVTNNSVIEAVLSGHPSGLHLVYSVDTGKLSTNEIGVVGIDGLNPHIIYQTKMYYAGDPAWSPDGTTIAFFTSEKPVMPGSSTTIALMNPDGTNVRFPPYRSGAFSRQPAWSPDGKKIVFIGGGDAWAIMVMNLDGSDSQQITEYKFLDNPGWPAWSPDGKSLAFNRGGKIYLMNPDGTEQRSISTVPYLNSSAPVWSPDGKYIAFTGTRGENNEPNTDIYVMNSDGSNVRRITTMPSSDGGAVWIP